MSAPVSTSLTEEDEMDGAGHRDTLRTAPPPSPAALAFWREYLAGVPKVLELPRDHRRPDGGAPDERRSRRASEPLSLDEDLTTGLRSLSHQAQVTLPTTLTAAFSALIHRYTGQEDFLVGVTGAGGNEPGPGGTVVLRADLAGEPSVLELLKRTDEATESTRSHRDVPFDAIADAVGPAPGQNDSPLVQVQVAFAPAAPTHSPDREPADSRGRPGYDLCMELGDIGVGVTGALHYDGALYEPETVRRMVGHWQMVLAGMVAEPWGPVGRLQLLAPPERQQLLEVWSTGKELTPGPDVAASIAEQAVARPDAVAVECEDVGLTYRQLDARANQLARHLREQGVTKEVPVGVCLERSVDHVVALLGILRAGGAYVPLDPEAPAERIHYVLHDSQMPLLLTHASLEDRVDPVGVRVVCLDREREEIAGHDSQAPSGGTRADQLAYVIYTSGSTGRPKGVMIERGSLSGHTRAMIAEYQLGPDDRVLQFSQYSADASLEQILPTLAAGGTLVMRGPEIWTPWQLLEELVRRQVTVMNLSPAHFQQAVHEWTRTRQDLTGVTLRLAILGGERLGAHAVQQWRDLGLEGVRLLNAYGPTEATITATLGEAGEEEGPITIGRPLAGRRVYILDRGGQPVPAGVAGELHIGGPLLARGYLNRPELTSERFVPDPFGPRPGGRLYRTGDLVRYLGDGRIDYLGREDEQVQIRGYRIELGEVEAVLGSHPAVDEAVVVARGDDDERHLVAFVVARTGQTVPDDELRRHLEERLPRPMQPASIVQLEEIPRLATGKADRRRLPEVERATRSGESEYLAPQVLAQEQLVRIWEELLEPRPIGIRDNFFHLGGHSLLAAQLVYRIEQMFGEKVALSTLFANPTIEQLSTVLHQGVDGPEGKARVLPVQTEGGRRPFFFLHGDWTGGAFYCFALARACGTEQPFYVLEPYTFSRQDGVPTLEVIAGAHIEAMRGVQAHGPYRLGGFCNGGLLAYEMARQLEAQGESVEFLGLVNPSEPVQSDLLRTACDGLSRIGGTGDLGRSDLYLRARHALRHLYRRARPTSSRVEDFGKLVAIEPRLEAMFPPREALYRDYVGVLSWAAAAYRTGIYHGRITFFWAKQEPDIASTWQPVTRHKYPADIEEHGVEGTHMSCITEGIDGLAGAVGECLRRVEQEASTVEPEESRSPSAQFRIRPLRGRDLWKVVDIERRAFPPDPWTTATADGRLARSWIGRHPRRADRFARLIRTTWANEATTLLGLLGLVALGRSDGLSYIVAEADSGVVGYACLSVGSGGDGGIQTIAVEPECEGRGIGRAMLADLIATAAARGCSEVTLYVRITNARARLLYQRTGFVEVDTLPGYYQPSGTDAVVMRLDVDGLLANRTG